MNTTTTVHRVEYKWRIDHYSYYIAKENDFDSPIFSAATENKIKWRLEIGFAYTDSISLYLYADSIDKRRPIFAKYKLAILDDQQYTIHTCFCNQIRKFKLGKCRGRGFKNLIERRKLNDGIFPNDEFTVLCTIIFSEDDNFKDDFDQPIPTQLQSPVNKFSLPENFLSLLENSEYSDVIVSCVNGKEFRVHKNILASRSAVFDAMFKYNMKENESNYVEISDIDEKVLEQMLRYIYTDRCENIAEYAEGLFVAADKYDLEGLKLRCEQVLLKNLSVENAAAILIIADMHHAEKLKSDAINFIVRHSLEVANMPSWNGMMVSHPQLLNEVFKAVTKEALSFQ